MEELQVIYNQEVLGQDFKIYGTEENPLFLAKDVANWIEHSNPSKMVKDADLDDAEVARHQLSTLTNSYTALFLTEATQYAVERGYLEVSEGTKKTARGTFTFRTTRVTGKGEIKIIEKLLKEKDLEKLLEENEKSK